MVAVPVGAAARLGELRAAMWVHWLALLAPSLLLLGAVYVYPLLKLLALSVSGAEPGLTAYRQFFESGVYLAILTRTFRIALVVTLVCLIMGYPLGYLLARVRPSTLRILMILILIPLWTSILVRTYAWMVLLQANGVLNSVLQRLDLVAAPLRLMYNEFGVVVGMTQVLLPFAILPIYASLRNIDPHLLAAARNLGADSWRTFGQIVFPLSLPGVTAAALLVFVQALGYFIIPALLGGSRVVTLAMLIETKVVDLLDWSFASAVAMILLGITAALVIAFDRLLGLDRIWA